MNDGPFKDPQEPPPLGRARFNGLSPLVEGMGNGTPSKSADPYFDPTKAGPARGTPHLRPELSPIVAPTPESQTVRPQDPALFPPEPEKWTPPASVKQDWNSPQPYSGDKGKSKLDQAVGSKSKLMVEARDLQRGSVLSWAIIAGTASGVLTEPLVKTLGMATDRASQIPGESLFARTSRGSANLWRSNFDPVGIHASQFAKQETLVTNSLDAIKKSHALEEKLLGKLQNGSTLAADEVKHMVHLKQVLKIPDDVKLVEVLMERQSHMHPDAINALNATGTGDHLAKIRALELSRNGQILTSVERGLLETRASALKNIFNVANQETLVTNSFDAIKNTHAFEENLIGKLHKGSALAADEVKHIVDLKQVLKIPNDEKLVEVLLERQSHMHPDFIKALNATETADHLANIKALELSRNGQILTNVERGLLETRELALKNIVNIEVASKGAGAETKWLTASGAWKNAKLSFFNTAGTGAVLTADSYLRERLYGKDAPSWESTSLTVPVAMALGNSWKLKAAFSALSVVGGHLIDNNSPVRPWVPESFKHFSAFDALPLGVAFAIPAKGKLARTAIVTAAVLAGNLAEGMSRKSAGDIEQTAIDTSAIDKTERSNSSFEKTVEEFRRLGKKNEVVLEQNLAQVLVESNKKYETMSQEEKLAAHRTTAALARALGEHHLENGTRLAIKTTDKPTYILDGLNLDMGGDALTYLHMSRNSVRGSKALTQILMDKRAFDKKVTEQELKDLDSAANKVDAGIEAVLGKHDIQKAMDTLKAFIDRGSTANSAIFNQEKAYHKTFVDDINKKLDRNIPHLRTKSGDVNPDAATIVAKLMRDYALSRMALAAHQLDHGNNPISAGQAIFGTTQGRNDINKKDIEGTRYDGVLDALRIAEHYAPNNPDLPELKAIAKRLAEQAIAKAPDQYNNYRSNPLGVRP